MRILHLSDTHVERTDAPNRNGVNATDSLRLMLAELRHLRDVDALVVTGDIANEGDVEAYSAVRELMGAFAQPLDAPSSTPRATTTSARPSARYWGADTRIPRGCWRQTRPSGPR